MPSFFLYSVVDNVLTIRGFPGGSVVKNPPANAGVAGSIPGVRVGLDTRTPSWVRVAGWYEKRNRMHTLKLASGRFPSLIICSRPKRGLKHAPRSPERHHANVHVITLRGGSEGACVLTTPFKEALGRRKGRVRSWGGRS